MWIEWRIRCRKRCEALKEQLLCVHLQRTGEHCKENDEGQGLKCKYDLIRNGRTDFLNFQMMRQHDTAHLLNLERGRGGQ